ncbi:hypothetical protein Dsin_019876 [Dipteronia sinensis]|uniref:RecQ-mediated genome instability protein 2 n=1 Tax=Dipteronia sinensis TaxID=43782 RepID=A0AAE0A860_9ROSI|nr:hypothetical protein Dsin_019876 [Dipteronia sinensis]
MDYSLAAVKVVCAQLKNARQTLSQNAVTLGGILFQRAWLQVHFSLCLTLLISHPKNFESDHQITTGVQGILISSPDDDGKLLLDDGTGVIQLSLAGEFLLRQWNPGMYVMVVGGYIVRTDDSPMIKVHKIVDLSAFPDRESMWYLEVIEAYKLFYQPLIEDFI